MNQTFVLNKNGIALVTALVMTLISLTIVMAVMYMITQNITRTGGIKRYRTALEASYGGSDMIIKEIVPELLKNFANVDFISDLEAEFTGIGLSVDTTNACLQDKLTKRTTDWDVACSQTFDLKANRDFSFQLQATGSQPYSVYTKIIDTVGGNTDTSGLQLEGAGVAESTTVLTPQHHPYVYRVEIQGERSQNAVERANLTVLYAY
ncbi:MAG: hypothetical protein ACYDG4_01920 [Desulfuromonadaceae bacterium]